MGFYGRIYKLRIKSCLPNVAPPGRSSAVTSTSILPPKLMGILVRTEADKRTDRSDPSVPSYRLTANPALTTLCRVCGSVCVHGGGIAVNSRVWMFANVVRLSRMKFHDS